MRPRDYRDGGAGAAIRFRHRPGRDPGGAEPARHLRDPPRRGAGAVAARVAGPVPARPAAWRRRRLRTAGGAGGGLRRVASTGTGPAAGRTRYGVPGTGLAGAAGNTAGQHGELCADCRTDRRAASGARGGAGLRGEPDRSGDSLPRVVRRDGDISGTAGAWSASANCCAGKSGIEPKARRYAARNAKSPLDGGLYAMGRWSFSWFQYPCQR